MFEKYLLSAAIRQVRHYKKTNLIRVKEKPSARIPLITCKRSEFNLYRDDTVPADSKFGDIPLASSGWQHYRSKHDYFVIHPHLDETADTRNPGYSKTFESFGIDESLVSNLRLKCNIDVTTPIQHESLPKVLAGNHTLIAAETGCGKTLAYLVPIVQNVLQRKRSGIGYRTETFNTPQVLILTPGRELAEQIGQVAEALCSGLDLSVETVIGGATKQKMLNPSMKPVDILVGSIGVISKLITTRIYRTQEIRHVVLDEADTMLDASFLPKLGYILRRFPFYKAVRENDPNEVSTQLVLAAATMPQNIEELLHSIIDTSTIDEVVSPNLHKILPHIQQKFIRMRKQERPLALLTLVKAELAKRRPIIVFGNKSTTSDYAAIMLNENGIDAISLNGDLIRVIRDGQFEKFQSGKVNVLSTTDIASRGLDTQRACHVINFDFPIHVADYIHRCGRIGRVGSASNCFVTNFVTGLDEVQLVRQIEHTARTRGVLPNVNADITGILLKKFGELTEAKKESVRDEEHVAGDGELADGDEDREVIEEQIFENESLKGLPTKS